MSRKYELEVKVRGLFDGGKLSISLAEQFYDMDFGALAQALAYDAEPIYRFRIDNFHDDCGEYRSERLSTRRCSKPSGERNSGCWRTSILWSFPLWRSRIPPIVSPLLTGRCGQWTLRRFPMKSTLILMNSVHRFWSSANPLPPSPCPIRSCKPV